MILLLIQFQAYGQIKFQINNSNCVKTINQRTTQVNSQVQDQLIGKGYTHCLKQIEYMFTLNIKFLEDGTTMRSKFLPMVLRYTLRKLHSLIQINNVLKSNLKILCRLFYESYVYFTQNIVLDTLTLELKVQQTNLGLYIKNIVLIS